MANHGRQRLDVQVAGPLKHDWAFVLGPERFNALGAAHTIAALVAAFGLILFLSGLATCSDGLLPPRDRRGGGRCVGGVRPATDG